MQGNGSIVFCRGTLCWFSLSVKPGRSHRSLTPLGKGGDFNNNRLSRQRQRQNIANPDEAAGLQNLAGVEPDMPCPDKLG